MNFQIYPFQSINIDNIEYHVPMSTTEGCLIASTQRGCKAISLSGGTNTIIVKNSMTRAPIISLQNISQSHTFSQWIENNIPLINNIFKQTTSHIIKRFYSIPSY